MKKLVGGILAALLTTSVVALVAPAAQAYPELTLQVTVNHQRVIEGHTFTFTAHASQPCTSWTASFNGETQHPSAGPNSHGTFTTPNVDAQTVINLTVICDTGNGRVVGAAGDSVMVRDVVLTRVIPITVLPLAQGGPHTSGTSGMPNTGGPDEGVLIGALALLAAGVGFLVYSRRRRRVAELS